MAIPGGVAELAVSVATAALKLGRRLDAIMAEEVALRSDTGLRFPKVAHVPLAKELRAKLSAFARDTEGRVPDPLGPDRARIRSATRSELETMCKRYGITDFGLEDFDPDESFRQVLLARNAAWDLSDHDILQLTYFVAAGADQRQNSLGFRLGATVLDVLAEFAAENGRYVLRRENTRRIVATVLERFAKPDLAEMAGWQEVLKQGLRATVSGLIDTRDLLYTDHGWFETTLAALARARDLAPNGDDFLVGLFRGEGFDRVVRGVLLEGAEILSADDAGVLEHVIADVLAAAARESDGAPDFAAYFQDNWHSLVAASLNALQRHGAVLLDEEDPLLAATLRATVGALAESFADGPPTADTLIVTAEAIVAVLADDPTLLEGTVGETWARELIGSVAGVVRDEGLRRAFRRPALERYAREALETLSQHPDILAGDGELVRAILGDVLGNMATVDTLDLETLADTAVESALRSIADKPELLEHDYAAVFGDLAGRLADRVGKKSLSALQAEDLLRSVGEVVATNSVLFLEARNGLAARIVEAVLDAADEDEARLLAGSLAVEAARRALAVMAARVNLLPEDETLDQIEQRFKEVIVAGVAQAAEILGRHLAQSDVPAVLARLVEAWLNGEIDLDDPDFAHAFATLAEAA